MNEVIFYLYSWMYVHVVKLFLDHDTSITGMNVWMSLNN